MDFSVIVSAAAAQDHEAAERNETVSGMHEIPVTEIENILDDIR